jgi:hypothetical protein
LVDSETGQSHVDAVTFDRSLIGTKQPQSGLFEAAGRAPVRAYDAPPWHSAAQQRHHLADLPWSPTAHNFGDISVGCDLAWWYLLDDAQHEFGILVIHRPHQLSLPGAPLNGPDTFDVIQPP